MRSRDGLACAFMNPAHPATLLTAHADGVSKGSSVARPCADREDQLEYESRVGQRAARDVRVAGGVRELLGMR
eukprot:2680786-Prymnesium_polylepis.1